jgi:hypothetical protein
VTRAQSGEDWCDDNRRSDPGSAQQRAVVQHHLSGPRAADFAVGGCLGEPQPGPPLYPNLVTLSPGEVDSQLGFIRELRSSLGTGGWAVKDSFNALDLGSESFEPLFDAVWVHRGGEEVVGSAPALVASRVESQEGLLAWEAAWGDGDDAGLSRAVRVFPAVLLEDADVAFLAVTDGHGLVGGVIANRAAGAVGVTNMFCRRGPERNLAAACMSAASAWWPGLPLVAYASGGELADLRSLGFRDLGELRVWRFMDTGGR